MPKQSGLLLQLHASMRLHRRFKCLHVAHCTATINDHGHMTKLVRSHVACTHIIESCNLLR